MQVVAVERVEVRSAVVERRNGVGAEDRVDGGRCGDHDAVERHALVALRCSSGVCSDRLDGDQHGGGDRLTVLQPLEGALDAVVLQRRIDVRAGRCVELLGGLGDEDVAVLVVHLPVVVAVERREVDEELPVEVVDAVAVEPDATGVSVVGDRLGAERSDVVARRVADDGDAVARRLRPVTQGAVLDRRVLGERAIEEQPDVDTGRRRDAVDRLGRCGGAVGIGAGRRRRLLGRRCFDGRCIVVVGRRATRREQQRHNGRPHDHTAPGPLRKNTGC